MNALLAAHAAQQAQQTAVQPSGNRPQGIQRKPLSPPVQNITKRPDNQNELENCFQNLHISKPKVDDNKIYVHAPLQNPADQIRLMLLAPASDSSDDIHCVLQTVTVAESKELHFSAISYACGDQTQRRDIFVGGAKLSVTYNLHEALRNIRLPDKHQRVWADAACIAQTDLKEKSHQILLMREIYSLATKVFIWLGESDSDLDTLFKQLSTIDPHDQAKQTATFNEMFLAIQNSSETTQAWIKLWQKPWFSRVWCVQEYLLASQIPVLACEGARVPWSIVNAALTTIDMLWPEKKNAAQRELQLASTHSLSGAMEFQYKYSKRLDLGAALSYTSSKQATDPRDKIYAILGLVSAELRETLAPNYTQSLSTLYQKAMVAMCREHLVLTPLWAAAETKTKSDLNLPSWCLDFSDVHWQDPFVELHVFPLLHGKTVSGACGSERNAEPAYLEHNPMTSQLTVNATVVGVIQGSLKMGFTPAVREHDRLEGIGSQGNEFAHEARLSYQKSEIVHRFLSDIAAASQMAYNTFSAKFGRSGAATILQQGSVWKAFDRWIITQQIFKRIWTHNGLALPAADFSIFELFLRRIVGKPVPGSWNEVLSPPERAMTPQAKLIDDCIIKSCLAMARAVPNRTFIVTDSGYTGQASTDVMIGDLVCVVFRCAQPLILRPSGLDASGEQLYELVASASVPGIMEGQVMERRAFVRNRFVLK